MFTHSIYIKSILITLMIIGPLVSNADEKKRVLRIDTDLNGQICWYENKKYSQGAILKIDQHHIICEIKYLNQPNGPLAWLRLDNNGEAIYPNTPKRITIN